MELVEPSREASVLPTGAVISVTLLSPICRYPSVPSEGRGTGAPRDDDRRDRRAPEELAEGRREPGGGRAKRADKLPAASGR